MYIFYIYAHTLHIGDVSPFDADLSMRIYVYADDDDVDVCFVF